MEESAAIAFIGRASFGIHLYFRHSNSRDSSLMLLPKWPSIGLECDRESMLRMPF